MQYCNLNVNSATVINSDAMQIVGCFLAKRKACSTEDVNIPGPSRRSGAARFGSHQRKGGQRIWKWISWICQNALLPLLRQSIETPCVSTEKDLQIKKNEFYYVLSLLRIWL